MTSPTILECINQSSSFLFFLLTPQDNHLLLKADMEDGHWHRGLKINWSMKKTYYNHILSAQLHHNYIVEGEKLTGKQKTLESNSTAYFWGTRYLFLWVWVEEQSPMQFPATWNCLSRGTHKEKHIQATLAKHSWYKLRTEHNYNWITGIFAKPSICLRL